VIDLWARLGERQAQVAKLHAMGHSSKYVAYELGIAPATVSQHLEAALLKLGLRSKGELIRDYAHLAEPLPPRANEAARLTDVEREIARLAAAGFSNAEIAALRRRSERTVANQMASILRKVGVSSRHQLGRLALAA
jgi:DNA-binding NarL/FixJ family response regulator